MHSSGSGVALETEFPSTTASKYRESPIFSKIRGRFCWRSRLLCGCPSAGWYGGSLCWPPRSCHEGLWWYRCSAYPHFLGTDMWNLCTISGSACPNWFLSDRAFFCSLRVATPVTTLVWHFNSYIARGKNKPLRTFTWNISQGFLHVRVNRGIFWALI